MEANMAGTFRSATARTGRWIFSLALLLVMAFWFGGGLLAGTIVARILRLELAADPTRGELIASSVRFWFSTAVIVASALLAGLGFFVERRRKAVWLLPAGMALLAIINQYAIGAWLSHTAEADRGTLDKVYTGIFFFQVAAAFGFIALVARSGKERREAEAVVPPPMAPPALPPSPPAPPSPEAALTGTDRKLAGGPPEDALRGAFPEPLAAEPPPPAAPQAGSFPTPEPSPFESPERPSVSPPAPPGEEAGPAGRPAGDDGEPDRRV